MVNRMFSMQQTFAIFLKCPPLLYYEYERFANALKCLCEVMVYQMQTDAQPFKLKLISQETLSQMFEIKNE